MSPLGSKSAKTDEAAAAADKKAAKAAAAAEKKAAKAAAKAGKATGKPAKAAAPAAGARGIVVEKPKFSVYSMLLVLSFLALLIGCLCLSAEMSAYNWEFKAR